LENPNAWLIANLEAALASRGWRAADLARASGITPSGIGAILKGRNWPSPDTLARMSNALKIKPDVLLRDPTDNQAVLKPAKLRLLELVAGFDEPQAEALLALAENLPSSLDPDTGELEPIKVPHEK
jgi:transcriptional regulator with XRE-family HTH domain